MNFDYDSWMKQARDRLELLYRQQEAITDEISALERGIEGFKPLTKTAWLGPNAGITESVRQILSSDPHRLWTSVQIRDGLLFKGVKLTQKNAMATIHQVLSRLVDKDVVKVQVDKGKNHYRWVGLNGQDDVMKPPRKNLLGEDMKK
ncbi:MAG: hypothetical protein ACLQKA_02995 [Bryobacteraceae bacterium]